MSLLKIAITTKIHNDVRPLLLDDFQKNLSPYFKDSEWELKIEFGIRGGNFPIENKMITPYIQQDLPELFEQPSVIPVTVLTAVRTFWEKITLLHAESHRDPQKSIPKRLFRHYYDIVKLDQKNITQLALQHSDLLADVLQNKIHYFPSKWANYETNELGKLHLYPNASFIESLRKDSDLMHEMFFGAAPEFDFILSEIQRIEESLNKGL